MSPSLHQVDAFAAGPFTGNPAAVCVLDEKRSEAWMQRVATEMNLSETAFLVPRADGYGLRWFTPASEVDLCGHATLASAHVLWESGLHPPGKKIRFETRSGTLSARRVREGIELDFPTTPAKPVPPVPALAEALGVDPVFTGRWRYNHLVEVDSEKTVRGVRPDFDALRDHGISVIVTSRSDDPEFDFVSRYFAPALGIDEDPVTGSAHCCLGPHWSERIGKKALVAFQASSRGGIVRVRVEGERTHLAGRAVTIFRGEWTEAVLSAG